MTKLLFALLFWIVATVPGHGLTPIAWEDLKDPEAARFEDPFDKLNIHDLRSIATVYRLRQQLTTPGIDPEDRPRLEEQLKTEETRLAESGVRTDELLAQRQTIAQKRVAAALKGNPSLAGTDIAITGYVIPVLSADGTVSEGYLVPGYGMCSHVPAPAPNQLIRYQLTADAGSIGLYEPVLLSGRLQIAPSRQTITLIDGQVEMIAAFDLKAADLQPITSTGPDATRRSFRSFAPQPDAPVGPQK